MKKVVLSLFLLTLSFPLVKADSSFLTGLEFEYFYQDNENVWSTNENGISPNDFSDFLLAFENSLGEKVALISALSSYCEFNLYRSNEDGNAYFMERAEDFERRVKVEYDSPTVEIEFLLYLLTQYDCFSPEVEKYKAFAARMPNSLTVQSVKVVAMAYYIVYEDKRDFAIRKTYREEFLYPYEANWQSYDQDIRADVYKRVISWNPYVDDCLSIQKDNGGELLCYCDIQNEEDLRDCFKMKNEEEINKIKNAGIRERVSDRETAGKLKESVLKAVQYEKEYISSLNISDLNKEAFLYFYLQKIKIFCIDLDGFYKIVHGNLFNKETMYMRRFAWNLNVQECTKYNLESTTSGNEDFYTSECFTTYMSKLDEDLNKKYKELGGASNAKLKRAQIEWLKMRTLFTKRAGNDFVAVQNEEKMTARDILANRVSMFHFYLNPDSAKEMYSKVIDKLN